MESDEQPVTRPEQVRSLLAEHDLSQFAEKILRRVKPAVQLRCESPTGAQFVRSRFGGSPDLPARESWPTRGLEALTFIAQIALDELPQIALGEPLPPRGLLSFFYDADSQPWGFKQEHRSGWRVLYTEPDQPLTRIDDPPRPLSVQLQSMPVSFVPFITVPTMRSIEFDASDEMSSEEKSRYFDFGVAMTELSWGKQTPQHQLWGHPDGIQGCMQRTAQFVSRGEYLPKGVHSYYEHPRAAELIPGSWDWQLLLQIDSDERLGSSWGDWGRIYFWIQREDLRARRFDRAWLFLQCG